MAKTKILVIDDEAAIRQSIKIVLQKDYFIFEASSGADALDLLQKRNLMIVFLDVCMPEMDGMATLKKIKELDPDIQVCMLTAFSDIPTTVEAMRLGAFDYITKPFDPKKLRLQAKHLESLINTRKENQLLKEILQEFVPDGLVTRSSVMQDVLEHVKSIAMSDSTVLLQGESGTGKEILARIVYKHSQRVDKPFIAVNCCAIPDHLMESEMFGFERGSFTGAFERKIGKFELADGGTLFLDEIGTMPSSLQAKLLRVIEDGEITRIGAAKPISVDVRLIAATHVNLKEAVKEKQFRADLYYRLNVVPIYLPALRERKEDIQDLFNYFQERFNKRFNHNSLELSTEALQVLENYPWPGNIRELENLVERLLAVGKKGMIRRDDLPLDFLLEVDALLNQAHSHGLLSFKDASYRFEKDLLSRTLAVTRNNKGKAAKLLGLHRNTLTMKMKDLGIEKVNEAMV